MCVQYTGWVSEWLDAIRWAVLDLSGPRRLAFDT